jgi:hypothetical protein
MTSEARLTSSVQGAVATPNQLESAGLMRIRKTNRKTRMYNIKERTLPKIKKTKVSTERRILSKKANGSLEPPLSVLFAAGAVA